MAKVTVGILTSFSHEVHEWSVYKARLEQWFLANDIVADTDKAGTKRRAILLSNLAESTYKLVRDLALPKEVGSLSYGEVAELLDGHFKTKRCTFAERWRFHSATQHLGEGLAEWAARVRSLAMHCGFKAAHLDEQLRDRFVLGLESGPERDTLFTKDLADLTLSSALDMAEGVRCARAGANETLQRREAAMPLQVMKVAMSSGAAAAARGGSVQQRGRAPASAPSGGRCSVCGYLGHHASACRFARYKCRKCGIQGHLKRMCDKLDGQHYVECREDVDDDGKRLCCNIRTFRGEPLRESVVVNGVSLVFEIDTGSPVTVISEQMYKRYFSNISLKPSDVILHSYNGDRLNITGVLNLTFNYNNKTNEIVVYVVFNGGPPLLGRDFFSRFNLQICSINNCNNFIEDITSRYPNLFSNRLGCFKDGLVDLPLKSDSKPVFFKARPLPFSLRTGVEKELDRLVDLGILVPVKYSDYASPIVPVLKRDGSIRLCADYSVTINKQLLVDKYPLPRHEELFIKLHGGKFFSKLDLSQAYNQLVLNEGSQMLTCVNTHKGLFKFTRLVFGLASAPAIFQRTMETVLSGLDGTLLFMDDVCICAENRDQMMSRLCEVFRRLEEAGFVLNKEKCTFFQESVSYLGFVIDRNGIHKSPEKVESILQSRVPTNTTELKSFLGMVNYYRNFVKNASSILCPLHQLLQKNVEWSWSKEHDEAVVNIKRQLASDNILTHFNPDATELILTVDASPYGLGAVLSQIEEGTEKPISYMSRSLNSAEKKYSQIQKEATAIIFGVKKFHQYLYGRDKPFLLRTDHKPLISIFNPDKGIPEISANRLQRYAIFLSAYNYKIEYVSSVHNCADYLSRSVSVEASSSARAHSGAGDESSIDRTTYVRFVYEGERFLSLSDVQGAVKRDIVMSTVVHFILNGWPKDLDARYRTFFSHRLELSVENNCLMRGHKLVIPDSLQINILKELHKGHLGVTKMKEEARHRFWWPGMSAAIEKHVGACGVCMSQRAAPPRAPLTPWPYPAVPWHRVHLDFLGPISGKTYLIVVDAYSKWVECFDVSNGFSSRVVIEKLCEVMARFGLIHTICSDNGSSFVSAEFKKFCLCNSITHLTSPIYNPASNGQAESYVKIIKRAIKSILLSGHNIRDINIKLQEFLLNYRNSIHSTTNRSPAEVLFGHKLRCRLDLLKPNASLPLDIALDKCVKSKQCLQSDHYRGNRQVDFKIGDVVLVKLFNQQKQYWTRGVVDKKIGKSLYLVRLDNKDQTVKRHANQLLRYKGGEDGVCQQGVVTYEAVPVLILPSEQNNMDPPNRTDSNSQTENVVIHVDPSESNDDGWFDCGDENGQSDNVTTAPRQHQRLSVSPVPPTEEVTTRPKRTRKVVDYKKFC